MVPGLTSPPKSTSSVPLAPVDIDSSFQVPWSVHVLSGLAARFPGMWKLLGNLETATYSERLPAVVDRPIFISGIARSGSTILLEILAAHAQVGTHRYRDFPLLHTPIWWHQATERRHSRTLPVERTHGDGIMVTPDSPEAMEESLWMSFFPQAHDSSVSQFLNRTDDHPAFEAFYRDHLRKVLYIRGRTRYVSKGNYNLSRLPYLHKMFPDARFLVPIRHPVQHIASLMKQHRLFSEGETRYPRALAQMQRVGHFEFGLDRRPIHVGDGEVIREIQDLWKQGDEVRGWAKYWSHLYGWTADLLHTDSLLGDASLVVRFEDLCSDPHTMLERLVHHCRLEPDANVSAFEHQIHAPTYYKVKFTDDELAIIAAETSTTAARYGYDTQAPVGR